MPKSISYPALSQFGDAYALLVKRVTIVMAQWCPHCNPLSLNKCKKLANELGASLRILDIDVTEEEKIADGLVEKYGEWTENYVVPQVFLEYDDGNISHILSGSPWGLSETESLWERFLSGSHYKALKDAHSTQLNNKGRLTKKSSGLATRSNPSTHLK
jgi:thiol-disulfide isomerase/thioredoxin